jgi:hypothetical protein
MEALMLDQSSERFNKRLDTRIVEVEKNIRDLNKKLEDLQSLCLDPSITLKMLLLASQHLNSLKMSRKVMQEITISRRPDHPQGDQQAGVTS